jgi:hypothetical protein
MTGGERAVAAAVGDDLRWYFGHQLQPGERRPLTTPEPPTEGAKFTDEGRLEPFQAAPLAIAIDR